MSDNGATHRIKDGRQIVIREPRLDKDLDRLVAFLCGLPDDIRNYMRYDVHDRGICAERLKQLDGKNHWRLIAELEGKIVADGTLDREPFGWTRHVADLRAIVDPDHYHMGISTILCRALIALGSQAGVEKLYTEVVAEQADIIKVVKRVGFVHEVTRKQYAKGQDGRLHDLLIFSNDLDAVWRKLEDQLNELDVPPYYSGG
ncbi:MAG: GNAT family protein [Deltaproteobacteria bacterium]|nr:GNAT family protein [Deltaproteobacteria bacterium]